MTPPAESPTLQPSSQVSATVTGSTRFAWKTFLVLAVMIKLVVLLVDPNTFAFLGDSASYLATARSSSYTPLDRSFTYGYAIWAAIAASHRIFPLLCLQTLAGIATAVLTALILVRHLQTRPRPAMVIALLVTVEPFHLMYERMIMTECISTLMFTAMLAAALEAIRRQSVVAILLVAVFGIVGVSYRTTLMPSALAAAVLTPVLATWQHRRSQPLRTCLRRGMILLLVSLAGTWGIHAAYKHWYGHRVHLPPAYNYYDGFFVLAATSPLLLPQDTDDSRAAAVISESRAAHPDGIYHRSAEMWQPQGIVACLRDAVKGDVIEQSALARNAARRAISRDPVAFFRLGLGNYRGFFSNGLKSRLRWETGYGRAATAKQAETFASYGVADWQTPTLMRRIYPMTQPWIWVVLHTPLVLAAAWLWNRRVAIPLALPLICSWLLLGSTIFLATEPVPRYLHPQVAMLAMAVGAFFSTRTASPASETAGR